MKKLSLNIPDWIFNRILQIEGSSTTDKILYCVKKGLISINQQTKQKPVEPDDEEIGNILFTTENDETDFDSIWFGK